MAFNKGYRVYISPEPVADADMLQAAFVAIDDWVEMINCGELPERGRTESELTWNTLAHGIRKGKGSSNFGSGDFTCLKRGTNAGREAFIAAANTDLSHAVRLVAPDSTGISVGDMTATTEYLRVLVSGPITPSGGDEQADVFRFPVMVQQQPIIVPSAEITE